MNLSIQNLHAILPLAAEWAASQELRILAAGTPLTEQGLRDARKMGVAHPESIRLLCISSVPMPENPMLREAAIATRLISPYTAGMSIRYGIFVRKDSWGDRVLIAHECVHTAQYERLGGIAQFLEQYLSECIEIGYPAAPMEQDAILKSGELRL